MKHCQRCNQVFSDDLSYCLSCGNPLRETSAAVKATRETDQPESFVRCPQCQKFVRAEARWCKHCGAVLRKVKPSPPLQPEPPPTLHAIPPQWPPAVGDSQSYKDDFAGISSQEPPTRVAMPTSPVRNDYTARLSSSFQSRSTELSARRSSFRWWHVVGLIVFSVGVIAVLGLGGWWWFSSEANRNSAARPTNSSRSSASPATPEPTPSANLADSDLRRLQERVSRAKPSDSEILTSIADAEEKYPDDYRFTYERAKLFGKGMISHDEAWEALRQAASKAIDNNHAEEMSSDMRSKADTDFFRLSRGHAEWSTIIHALETRNKAALKHDH